jgi:hypothetical protein
LPPGAQPIEFGGQVALERELNASKARVSTVPFTHYDLSQIVNGLAILECAMFEQQQFNIAAQVLVLQQRLVRDIPFSSAVRDQFQANRAFLKLPQLPDPK